MPTALVNLGLLHLKSGNLPEASAYFGLLKSNNPKDQNVPFVSYYWGDYHFERGEWQKAADFYQDLVQNYPSEPSTNLNLRRPVAPESIPVPHGLKLT
ncbi:MAG: tetratricopeptide repeat protein [Candidatus Omnitrophota bacterium]